MEISFKTHDFDSSKSMIEYMKSMFSNRCTNSSLELKIGKNIIPQIVIRCTIEKITRDFLWSRALDVSHDHLVSCCHKKEYGLSLGNVVYNIVLVAKWLWCFPLECHSWWHQVIWSKYHLDRNGWATNITAQASVSIHCKFISQGYTTFTALLSLKV